MMSIFICSLPALALIRLVWHSRIRKCLILSSLIGIASPLVCKCMSLCRSLNFSFCCSTAQSHCVTLTQIHRQSLSFKFYTLTPRGAQRNCDGALDWLHDRRFLATMKEFLRMSARLPDIFDSGAHPSLPLPLSLSLSLSTLILVLSQVLHSCVIETR